MSVSLKAHSLSARFSRWLLACALRHWPAGTRAWGVALAAEVDETTDTLQTLLWSWGGIMLFTRSMMSSVLAWLKLPAGASLPGSAAGSMDPSTLPRRSRLLTAVVLLAVAVVFLSPMGREATTTVRAGWSDLQQSPSDRRALETLAARAEQENDAETLAFVALNIDDPKRSATVADLAISLSPEFAWIYGPTHLWPDVGSPAWEQRLEHLQASDPGNAVPVLLAAASIPAQRAYENRSPVEIEAMLASNPKWMALMARAVALPRYDSYVQRQSQLTSRVWARERYLSPAFALRGFWRNHGNPMGNLGYFSRIRAHEAEKAFAAGDLKEAERLLDGVDLFGERMANENSMVLEKAVGLGLAIDANKKLAEFYTSAGRTADAKGAGLRVKQLDERQAGVWQRDAIVSRQKAFRRAGILVQIFGILAVLAGFAALAGILLLEVWPARLRIRKTLVLRVLCWAADYGPATSLIAGGALLLSFLPYAHAFSEYRTSAASPSSQMALDEALSVFIPTYGWRAEYTFLLWSLVTLTLSVLAAFIIARSFYRERLRPIRT